MIYYKIIVDEKVNIKKPKYCQEKGFFMFCFVGQLIILKIAWSWVITPNCYMCRYGVFIFSIAMLTIYSQVRKNCAGSKGLCIVSQRKAGRVPVRVSG